MSDLRIAYAGDRQIAVQVLDFILGKGVEPLALIVPDNSTATHADALIERCPHLSASHVMSGATFRQDDGLRLLESLQLDYLICIHFPLLIPAPVLQVASIGSLNLHPAFLPYNRGWHTPSWAILDGTPYGASLHFMDERVDMGDIVHQKRVDVLVSDTAHTLYQKALEVELKVFEEAWPSLVAKRVQRVVQQPASGSSHRRQDLLNPVVQEIRLDSTVKVEDFLRQLRALTTSSEGEAAYFDVDGKRYRVQVRICEEQ
ncbi:MAG: formyltransferase family protein [Mariprofundaceae bacterium]